jgi:molybdopterin-binding protein
MIAFAPVQVETVVMIGAAQLDSGSAAPLWDNAARMGQHNALPTLYQHIWYFKMPRKEQGWITFQSSDEERQILEQICQQTQRTKTEILREMIRQMGRSSAASPVAFSEDAAEEETNELINPDADTATQPIQISARNVLRATVKQIVKDNVNVEVTLAITPEVELVSIVTRTSAERLGLKKGKAVFAVIKSNSVMIAAR